MGSIRWEGGSLGKFSLPFWDTGFDFSFPPR